MRKNYQEFIERIKLSNNLMFNSNKHLCYHVSCNKCPLEVYYKKRLNGYVENNYLCEINKYYPEGDNDLEVKTKLIKKCLKKYNPELLI